MSNKRVRRWCMTLNNYSSDELYNVQSEFDNFNGCNYIIGKEVGEEGTPHLQIYVDFKGGRTFSRMKKINDRLHIEPAKGSFKQNIVYCSKDGDYITNIKNIEDIKAEPDEDEDSELEDELPSLELYDYQKQVLDIIKEKPDKRKIYWFWEPNGKAGKSCLCRHILINNPRSILVSGKASDIKCAIIAAKKKPKIVLWDIPRALKDDISYETLEEIKNGQFFSGKYESGMCIYNPPHIIVFANWNPAVHKLSSDRWVIEQITI